MSFLILLFLSFSHSLARPQQTNKSTNPLTTFLQALMRRTLQRIIFLRWKKHAIVIQKYVRCWEGKMLLHRTYRAKFTSDARPLGAIIWLQVGYRRR
jgi:hypothetical protein